MPVPTIAVKESRADLLEIGPSTGLSGFRLVYVIGKGLYQWQAGDQSSNVPSGNDGDVWVAPAEDTSGKSGAWQFDDSGILDPEHATDSGTDAFVSATNTSTPGDGVKITRDFQSANTTTTPTLDGKTMTTRDGSALWAGAVSGVHELQYDSGADTYLVLEPNPSIQDDPVARLDTFTAGHIDGLELSNNGTDSDHDIDIATGVCSMRDGSGNRKLFELTSGLTKQIDADWAEGTDAGGFPSGLTLSADTEYNVFLIGKDDGSVDAGFDTGGGAASLLSDASNYSWKRRIGSVFTDGSSNIRGFFVNNGDYFYFNDLITDVSDSSVTSQSSETVALTVPNGSVALISAFANGSNCQLIQVEVVQGNTTTVGAEGIMYKDENNNAARDVAGYMSVVTSTTTGSVKYEGRVVGGGSETLDNIIIKTRGYIDDRGRNA